MRPLQTGNVMVLLLVSVLSEAACSFPGLFPSKSAVRTGRVEMSQQNFSCLSLGLVSRLLPGIGMTH